MNDVVMKNIKDNEFMIYKIASKYRSYYNIEDLYQAGCIGIIKATRKYDENSNTKFSTYAFKYILGEMIDYIRKERNIIVSDDIYNIYKKYIQIKEMLSLKYERDVSFDEICLYMQIDQRYMLNIIESINVSKSIDEDEKLFNSISFDNREDIDMLIMLKSEIASLEEVERDLINYRYYQGYSQDETARLMGTNQVKVSRQEKQILLKMKDKLSN